MKVEVRKNKDAAQLHEMLCAWRQASAMLKQARSRRTRRYRYPEFDTTRRWVKIPSQELSSMLVAALMEDREETK